MTRRGLAAVFAAAAIGHGSAALQAHRLDEYLQATRLSIEADRIDLEIDLTPGMTIASGIASEIDADRDGRFSPRETEAYGRTVIAALELAADGRALPLTISNQRFPDRADMMEGLGTIRLRASAPRPRTAAGRHSIEYRNGFRADASVYLANTMVPEDPRLTVAAQRRDPLQQRLIVEYEVASSTWARAATPVAGFALVGLVIVVRRRRTNRQALSTSGKTGVLPTAV